MKKIYQTKMLVPLVPLLGPIVAYAKRLLEAKVLYRTGKAETRSLLNCFAISLTTGWMRFAGCEPCQCPGFIPCNEQNKVTILAI